MVVDVMSSPFWFSLVHAYLWLLVFHYCMYPPYLITSFVHLILAVEVGSLEHHQGTGLY